MRNSNWAPTFYAGKKCIGEQDSVSINVRRHQTLNDQGQKYFIPPELNGQFLDHIYETIDDDALPPEDAFQADPRFPPAENYYGDHSDLSQHSSASSGYDHQPLINICPNLSYPKDSPSNGAPHCDQNPTLPDLLQSPPAVVLAVLDGERVVNRIQPLSTS